MAATQVMPAPRMDQAATARATRIGACRGLLCHWGQRRARASQAKTASMKAGFGHDQEGGLQDVPIGGEDAGDQEGEKGGDVGGEVERGAVDEGELEEEAAGEGVDDGGGEGRGGGR